MPIIMSKLGSQIGAFFTQRSYWAIKTFDDRWLCELDKIPDHTRLHQYNRPGDLEIVDFRGKGRITDRELDWGLDIVGSGDIAKVKELWLFCPPSHLSPMGNTATLRFSPQMPRTAFILKRGSIRFTERTMDYLIIGQVTEKSSGACVCFIWDNILKAMSAPFYTTVRDFAAWREGVMPIGKLSFDGLGLDVRDY